MAKNTLLKNDEQFDGLPPWMAQMRKSVLDCITEEDVKAIVQNQVKKAKEGDPAAIKFVFGQLLGGDTFKGATFVQNNNYGETANPQKPAKALPQTDEKIDLLRRRAEAGLPLHVNGDASHSNTGD